MTKIIDLSTPERMQAFGDAMIKTISSGKPLELADVAAQSKTLDLTTLRFTEEQIGFITKALEAAVDHHRNMTALEQDNVLKASFYWRTAQPSYDPNAQFADDCAKYGSD